MRPPPDVTAAARTGGSRKGLRGNVTKQATSEVYAGLRPFIVTIRAWERRAECGRFATRAEAEAAAAKLRRYGFEVTIDTGEAQR